MNRSRLGEWGEAVAIGHLRGEGYSILTRNWHSRDGELDIVAQRGDEIVFVEVKARSGDSFGSPEEAVTLAKQRRLQRAAWAYLDANTQLDRSWRIDVIAIERLPDGRILRLDHYENAIDAATDL